MIFSHFFTTRSIDFYYIVPIDYFYDDGVDVTIVIRTLIDSNGFELAIEGSRTEETQIIIKD